ncbi:MAG: GWxTD domain-containing protein [bacterium]|nr:GWxTD domain-containing protein [bacterium]
MDRGTGHKSVAIGLMKSRTKYPTLVFLLFLLITLPLYAQPHRDPRIDEEIGVPRFKLEPVVVFSEQPGMARVLLNLRIPLPVLLFVKADSQFHATITAQVEATPTGKGIKKKKAVSTVRTWVDSVCVSEYRKTNNRREVFFSKYALDLSPGTYKLRVRLTDNETRKSDEQTAEVTLHPRANDSLSVTPPVLARSVDNERDPKRFQPTASDVFFPEQDSGWVYFEVLVAGTGTLRIEERVVRDRGAAIRDTIHFIEPKTSIIRYAFRIPLDTLSYGTYQHTFVFEQAGQRVARVVKYKIGIPGIVSQIYDLDIAIKQLKYLAEEKKVKEILSLPLEQKENAFRLFWEQRDPSPETPVNEKMQEYYRRIELANSRFTRIREGWETDRGQVLVIYGDPTEVDSHPTVTQGKPYEIWFYSQRNLRFTFIDQDGFGDYRLESPLWE